MTDPWALNFFEGRAADVARPLPNFSLLHKNQAGHLCILTKARLPKPLSHAKALKRRGPKKVAQKSPAIFVQIASRGAAGSLLSRTKARKPGGRFRALKRESNVHRRGPGAPEILPHSMPVCQDFFSTFFRFVEMPKKESAGQGFFVRMTGVNLKKSLAIPRPLCYTMYSSKRDSRTAADSDSHGKNFRNLQETS